MNQLHYMRIALEKDASLGSMAMSAGRKILGSSLGKAFLKSKSGSAMAGAARGTGRFAKAPIRSTLKKVLWSRAKKPGQIGKNIRSELGFGATVGGGTVGAGILATPIFTNRNV